jgi:hypothetical protein
MGRSKLAIFAVVAFLGLVTYLLITMSTQLAQMPVTTGSNAQLMPDPGSAELVIVPTSAPGLACGKECGVKGTGSDWEKPCESGSSCQYQIIAFGIQVGVCRPASGGACPLYVLPLPQTSCGRVCSDERGTVTASCPSGTSCVGAGFLGYKTCKPTNGGQCPNTTIEVGRGGLQPAPTLTTAACGQVCMTRQSGTSVTVAQCATGTTCQSNPSAGGYSSDSRCYSPAAYGTCPSAAIRDGGNRLPVNPTGGQPQ